MNKKIICYFSASGTTKKVAERIANSIGADLFEIEPTIKYTRADLNWLNRKSRSSIEMSNKDSRPEIAKKVENINDYDTVIIGFPVWWYTAPTIINTFIEENDLSNKKIYVFVTSGGSSQAKSFKDLKEKYPSLNFVDARRFKGKEDEEEYKNWLI